MLPPPPNVRIAAKCLTVLGVLSKRLATLDPGANAAISRHWRTSCR